MNNSEGGYYYIIPSSLVEDGDHLKALLYGLIVSLCNKTGSCWASNNYLAKRLGRSSARIISSKISQLVSEGYIKTDIDSQGVRLIALTPSEITLGGSEKTLGGARNYATPPSEKTLPSISNKVLVESTSVSPETRVSPFPLVAYFVDKCRERGFDYKPLGKDYGAIKRALAQLGTEDEVKAHIDQYFSKKRDSYSVLWLCSSFGWNALTQEMAKKRSVDTIPTGAWLR